MRLVIGLSFLYCISASLDYPTACDCSEHLNEEACKSHSCHWANGQCQIQNCEDRTIEKCISGSHFLSSNPKYCFIKDNKCIEMTDCEQLYYELNPIQAREQCQLYQCAFDLVSGYCFKPQQCEEIYDDLTCDSFLIASSDPLQIQSVCYWDGSCKARDSFVENCNLLEDQYICEQGGCYFDKETNQCKELQCQYRTIKDCNGEYINHQGQVFVCYEQNDKCEEKEVSKLHKNVCNSMIGHTYDEKECKKCDSYASHSK